MCGSCGPDADEPIPLIKHRKERCCTLGVHYGEKVSLASAATLRSANGALPPPRRRSPPVTWRLRPVTSRHAHTRHVLRR